MENIDEFLEKYISMLPTEGSTSEQEVQRRASEFLVAMAHLTDYKHKLGDEKIKTISIRDAEYAKALNLAEGGDANKRKANAEAAPDYVKAREEHETVENKLYTINTYVDIFKNAHHFYRKMMKDMGEMM